MKVFLAHAISHPIKAHVNSFGALLLDSIVGYASGSAVVCLHWCGRLEVSEFFKGGSDRTGFCRVVKEGTKFSFGCTETFCSILRYACVLSAEPGSIFLLSFDL